MENFGCRASQADGEAIAAELAGRGGQPVPPRSAGVVVLNTCAVTAEAERKARAFLRRLQRENPAARVVVTGCYAQRAPQQVAALPGVSAVVGNSHKALAGGVAAGLAGVAAGTGFVPVAGLVPVLADERFAHADLAGGLGDGSSTRPSLKVQDGCGNRCSFCIIPAVRGRSRSLPLAAVLDRVRRFAEAGGCELVLSGINLGRWGGDLDPRSRFEDLVFAILERTGLARLRLSSVEPMDWTADLLALYRQFGRPDASPRGPRLARHAHLPLQSGADATLRAMHRRYRPWHYAERLAAIRAAVPEAAIGADVMVGFPGETDAVFEQSLRFIEAQPFTYLHLFPFSPRPGTAAGEMARRAPVPAAAVRARMAALATLARERQAAFRRGLEGRPVPAITLRRRQDGRGDRRACSATPALTDHFVPIEITGDFAPNRMLWCIVSERAGERDDGRGGGPNNAGAMRAVPVDHGAPLGA